MSWLAVFVGGTLGSLLRGWLWTPGVAWVTGSLLANALACLVIGALHGRDAARRSVGGEPMHPHALAFGAVGFCGGLSTFSAFAADLGELLRGGDWPLAAAAAGLEIVVGLGAVLLGVRLGRRWRVRLSGRGGSGA